MSKIEMEVSNLSANQATKTVLVVLQGIGGYSQFSVSMEEAKELFIGKKFEVVPQKGV
jgi:hypothetical protein